MHQQLRTLRNLGLWAVGLSLGVAVYLMTRLWFWLAVIALLLWRAL